MRSSDHQSRLSRHHRLLRLWPAVVMLVVSSVAMSSVAPASAVTSPYRIDLRVLLLDDNSPWVDAIESQMQVEGVPYTTVLLGSPSRQVITPAFLASGDRAFFQAVVGPDYALGALTDAELTALRAYEAKFGVREVDGYNWANPAVGLNYAAVFGDINGTIASVTAAGRAAGFGYLNGPVPFSIGSYSYLAEPLASASLPAGASYSTLLGAPLPSGATGSLIGVYSNAGVEQLVITAAFSFTQPQFKYVAHGIITWATRGVHFGYNRNNLTFHVDDAFSEVATWDSTLNCTPGEDCPGNLEPVPVRMTPADVTYAVAWQQANNYRLTLAFNGAYAYEAGAADPLADSLRSKATSFRWLNHGFEHLYQGCVQNFAVVPWQCTFDADGIVWMSQQAVYEEMHDNIVTGQSFGLPFDPTEYLSGEHSGLFLLPQQPLDNPNFTAALTQAGILHIGSDASRDNVARQVGTATTIPRHPTALYYNTATKAAAVDEYNWFYTTAASGGSGMCGTTVPPCIPPLDPATDFTSYIVPTDAAFDMNFILSNDPRPFYAHTSNMTGDRLLYLLLDEILSTYRTAFTTATPLVNMTLTQASTELDRQTKWATAGSNAVTGYIQNNQINVTNTAGVWVPFTAPTGSVMNGTTLQPYGGEVSSWLAPGSTTGSILPVAPVFTSAGATTALSGTPFTFTTTTTGSPAPAITMSGALPAGIAFADLGNGTATLSGTPSHAAAGQTFPITFTATNPVNAVQQAFVLTVSRVPEFTSAASAGALSGVPFSFTVHTVGSPTATIALSGSLPTGITFTDVGNGTATVSGTAAKSAAGHLFPLTFTATNSAGHATQAFSMTVDADYMSLVSLTPARLADTRPEATVDGLYAGQGVQPRGSTMELLVAGRGGVPLDAAAVALNVTVAEPTGSGFVTVYPCGAEQPLASNLNFTPGAVVPNAVIAKIGVDGKVCLFVSNHTQLIVDVNGYFPKMSSFRSMNPARVLETRPLLTTIDGLQQGEGIRSPGTITTVQVTDRVAVPADATAVVLNVTVTEAQGPGFVTVYPCGTAIPTASNVNYVTGSTVANLAVAKVGADGGVCIYNSDATHLVVDVNGYFPGATSYKPINPARLLETRSEYTTIDGLYVGAGIRPAGTITDLTVANRGGVPADAATVVLNVTVTEPTAAGYVTVYPCGPDVPLASNLNYEVGMTVAIAAIVQVSSDGKVCLFNSGATQLVVDVDGYLPS